MGEWYEIKTRFPRAIEKNLEENNMVIPFLQRMVYLHSISEKKQVPNKSKTY